MIVVIEISSHYIVYIYVYICILCCGNEIKRVETKNEQLNNTDEKKVIKTICIGAGNIHLNIWNPNFQLRNHSYMYRIGWQPETDVCIILTYFHIVSQHRIDAKMNATISTFGHMTGEHKK